jgi:hypothetical protein
VSILKAGFNVRPALFRGEASRIGVGTATQAAREFHAELQSLVRECGAQVLGVRIESQKVDTWNMCV